MVPFFKNSQSLRWDLNPAHQNGYTDTAISQCQIAEEASSSVKFETVPTKGSHRQTLGVLNLLDVLSRVSFVCAETSEHDREKKR